MNINIIYNAWINKNRNWKIIIESQLKDIILTNILEKSKLYIILIADSDELINESKLFIEELLNIPSIIYNIDTYTENHYEYYGIKKLYDLSNSEPDKLYLYIHTKGMFNYYDKPDERNYHEQILTRTTINPWLNVVEIFNRIPTIKLMGMFPSIQKWIWFNFFWVRGSYIINNCEEPIISENRYYYESWLNKKHNQHNEDTEDDENNQIYNMYQGNFTRYSAQEALSIINNIDNV